MDTLDREVMLANLRHTNARLRRVIANFLEAPYLGGTAISLSITNACFEANHPRVKGNGSCACGRKS